MLAQKVSGIRMISDSSTAAQEARRHWDNAIKIPKDKDFLFSIFCLAELSIKFSHSRGKYIQTGEI